MRETVSPLFSLVKRESVHDGAAGIRRGDLRKPEKKEPGPGSSYPGRAERDPGQITFGLR